MNLKEQILSIRDSGRTNMLDARAVQRIAHELGYHNLVIFIEDNRASYAKFIMSGDEKYLLDTDN